MADIFLESFGEKHLDRTFQWIQDENLKTDFMFTALVTKEGHRKWYKQYCEDKTQKIWAVYNHDVHVGNVGLKNIDLRNKKAEAWIYVGERQIQGKHIGSNTWLTLLKKMDFTALGLHKVYSHGASWNIASRKMFLRAGFQEEGILNDEVYFRGEYVTLYRFAIILNI